MAFFPVFLSVVFVVRNQSGELQQILTDASSDIAALVSDYELIVVDNASTDDSVTILKRLTGEHRLPNLQVYALTKKVDDDTAAWVGLENALGDFVAVLDPLVDDLGFLPSMLDHAASGADVVFASNQRKSSHGLIYRAGLSVFNALYKRLAGIDLVKEAPRYRILSKRLVNFILQHPQPGMNYRHLPVTGGFPRVNLTYDTPPKATPARRLGDSVDRAIHLLVSTTRAPMRLVTILSLFGAVSNLVYSGYVIAVAILKEDVAPGWITLSLQQSGMFFLISLVLLILGEYILQVASLSNEGPLYHVGQEFTSARITRRERLNVEDAAAASPTMSDARSTKAA